ncbi:MAG: DNA internalization-related competence protein ComEC/Rec2 [Acidobacteriota bacterium]
MRFDARSWQGPLLATCLAAGVAIGLITPLGWPTTTAAAIALGSLVLVSDSHVVRRGLVLSTLVAAGMCHGALARGRVVDAPLVRWLDEAADGSSRSPGPVLVRGRLAADAAATEFGVRLLIDVQDLLEDGQTRRIPGRIQAYVAGDLAEPQVSGWTAGRPIQAAVTLRQPQLLLNPGGPDPVLQMLRRPFHLAGMIKSAALVSVERGPWWYEAAAAVRRHVREAVSRHCAHAPQAAAIIVAILIGDRAGLADSVERRLQAAGTYHVIAISGGNVALLIVLCLSATRLLVRSHFTGVLVTLAFVVAYGWIVGAEPSVQRAVAAATVYLLARLIGLVPRALNVLATVAALLVVIDPSIAVDVGAWLSFGATLGIVLWANDLDLGFRLPHWSSGRRNPRSFPAKLMLALLAATLAAELALVPISASVFGRVTVAGLALNFVAIPAMAVVQVAGLALVLLDLCWAGGAAMAARAATLAASWLVGSASLVDVAPWLSWRVPPAPAVWTALYYAAWGCALWRGGPERVRRLSLAAALLAMMVVVAGLELGGARPGRGWLRVAMVNVGQGDAIAVQFPSGQSLLVDTGGGPGPFDIGSRVVTPALWALGIRRLEWLAVTHADLDHIGGARAVVDDLDPREIWDAIPVPRNRELQALRADAIRHGASWRTLQSGDRLEIGGVFLDVEHPPLADWERQKVRNDDSLVLRVTYRHVEFLLTGDAGAEFERRRHSRDELTPLRILKVAHHGSRSSTSADFLEQYQPQLALISVGRANLFGHPAPDVLARLRGGGAEIFRTDQDAAIIVETNGRVVHVRSLTGRIWQLRAW